MSEQIEELIDTPLISENGRLSITVGTTFTYSGQSHWPKVSIEDGPLVFLDEEGNAVVESADELIYRVTETTHHIIAALIARMKRDIDTRNEEDRAARARKQAAFSTEETAQ